jgi:hypothetical protein
MTDGIGEGIASAAPGLSYRGSNDCEGGCRRHFCSRIPFYLLVILFFELSEALHLPSQNSKVVSAGDQRRDNR